MNAWSKFLFGAALALAAVPLALAQQPLVGVTMTAPVNESAGAYTAPLTITATPVGIGPFSFTFFVNGTSIGAVTSSGAATLIWTPPQPGSYFLSASVTDATGNAANALPVRYFATGAVVNSPVSGTLVPAGSTVVLKADATTASGFIKQIQFFDNGTPIGTDTTAPYSLIYAVPGASGSVHTITATATDNNNATLTSSGAGNVVLNVVTAITPLPTSIISSPGNGAAIAIGGAIPISVDAASTTGRISKVELYLDGQLFGTKTSFPYTFSWTPAVVGSYTMVALTYDDKNNVIGSAPVTVSIAAPPTITVTAPSSGSTVTGGTPTQLRATATDSGGSTITNVEFFVQAGTGSPVFLGSTSSPVSAGSSTYQITATLTPQTDPVSGTVVPSTITARATNSAGISAISVGNTVTVTSGGSGGTTTVVGIPPTVSVTSPTAGTQVVVNVATPITANASDPDGNITSVQFFVNNTSVGTSTAYPYRTSWTPTSLGSYAITAKTTDNDGNVVTSAAVTVSVVDPTPGAPTVSVTSPLAGASIPVNSVQTLRATATDSGSITNVQFFVNGQPVGAAVSAFPYQTSWTPTSPGNYVITARATNGSGNQTTSGGVNVSVTAGTPPTVALGMPSGTTVTLGSTTNLTASATPGSGATIASVQFFANGVALGAPDTTFPYSMAWTPTAPGTYVLTAVARDSFGNEATTSASTVTVSVGSSAPPVITLTAPTTATTVAVNSPLTISANATDPDGLIQQVEFFANGRSLGTKTSAPYFVIYTPTTTGTHTISAIATDDAGNTVTSGSSVVTAVAVATRLPVVSLTFNDPHVDVSTTGAAATTNPFTPVKVDFGSKLILTANAAVVDGSVTKVQFFANGTSIGTVTSAPFYVTYTLGTLDDVVFTAIVTDSAGNSIYTNPILVDTQPAIDVTSSTVTLVSPTNGSTYPVGSQITFSATHNFGNVTPPKVDFYLNGVQFATVTAPPYQKVLGITRAGVYDVHAVARLNDETTVSAPARITVTSNVAPATALTSPADNSSFVVGTAVALAANATDPDGTIKNVQFFVNGIALSSDATAPYTATWSPAAPGSYRLTVVATDDADNQTLSAPITVTIRADQAPTVALTAPAVGTQVSSGTALTLSANATDADGSVASVRFLANGNLVGTASTAPYTTTWTPSAAGSYSVVAQATDNAGNVSNSSAVTVTVLANIAPTVALTTPMNGTTVRVGAGATLTATAADTDGTIASVQFFANGSSVGSDTTPPYSTTWTPAAEGIYRLTAVALDNAGASTTSATITVLAVAAGGGDAYYTGNYAGTNESGRFAMVSVRGKTGAFIAYSTAGATPRTYFFPSLAVDATGGFSATDASRVTISGAVNDSGVSGTLDGNRLTFIGPAVFPTGANVAAGYYTGNLTGRAGSAVTAIVAPDSTITVFITDGTLRDAGAGNVTASGAFTVLTQGGNRLTGTVDPNTGFLSGSLSGSTSASFMAAAASGVSFSDGFLRNLSTRGQVGTGSNILIAGFVVGGSAPKQVLVRAIGPSLTPFGITGALADPQLQLFNGTTMIASNDNWGGAADISTASNISGAFPLTPTSLDAAILITLAPGSYTAQVSGVGGRTGIALVELYDVDNLSPFSAQKVMNVSTRGVVGSGQGQLIAGFAVSGNTAKKVLIRAVGPTLAAAPLNVAGALADPILRLVRSDNTVIRENDNWETGNDVSLINDASVRVGAFPLVAGGRDAAMLVNLPPGTYSAQVSGPGTTTGVALVEVYEVP